jgi:hypothetical protein
LAHLQVRLKGQLFFDASHVPCRPGKPVNPARSSVWEIHPIYSVDVCKRKKGYYAFIGYMEGALNSGVRAARKLARRDGMDN